ncbi:hypothetical protein ACWEPC_59370, partial [Nonomuraea sp. NPDC004297]
MPASGRSAAPSVVTPAAGTPGRPGVPGVPVGRGRARRVAPWTSTQYGQALPASRGGLTDADFRGKVDAEVRHQFPVDDETPWQR